MLSFDRSAKPHLLELLEPDGPEQSAALGGGLGKFVPRPRAGHDAGAREDPQRAACGLCAADREHPVAVAVGVVPADHARVVAAVEGLDAADGLPRGVDRHAAHSWRRVQGRGEGEKKSIDPRFNPWTHPLYEGDVDYPEGFMDESLSIINRIAMIQTNPRLEPPHFEIIAAAIRAADEEVAAQLPQPLGSAAADGRRFETV